MTYNPSFSSVAYSPDRLLAGDHKHVTAVVTLTDNESIGALTRGAVLGFLGGSYANLHQTGTYPASTARAILADDADPSSGDVEAMVYLSGEFNEDELGYGGTVDNDDVREILAQNSIYLKSPVSV